MEGKNLTLTLMSITVKIFANSTDKCIDSTLYKNMIGILLYITVSRLDIAFSVDVCARFQANPKESHLSAIKKN